MAEVRYLTAGQAAEELGVSLATLYAYVSRGMIRSRQRAGAGGVATAPRTFGGSRSARSGVVTRMG